MRWIFALALAISQSAVASDNCSLQQPPRDAAVNVNHGDFFFVYPRFVGVEYTGCQTMWDEKGNKVWIVTFDAGKPTAMTTSEPPKPVKTTKCVYRNGALSEGPIDECVEYDLLLKGIPSISKKDEPSVPVKRDPRRH
jgi:hypothetical protein